MVRIRADKALTCDGWRVDVDVHIAENGRIEAITEQVGSADHSADLLLPSPTNLHSHSFQRAMSGLTEARGPNASDSFWTWRKLMYRFLQQLSPDQIEAIAAQVFMEAAEAGYAAVAEFHYLHHAPNGHQYENIAELSQRIANAAANTGIGLTLLPVLYEYGGCDGRALEGGQKRFGNTKDGFAELFAATKPIVASGPADWRLGIAPHSLRAVDQDGLNISVELVADHPVHMHLAEQVAEVNEIQAHLGTRPVEWVLDNLPVDDTYCFIHCTQMTATETHSLAKSGAVAGLCPITESNLGDGIFNGSDFLGKFGHVGFGSDSNVHISLWDEMKTLEYSQRLRDRRRAVLATSDKSTGRILFDAAVAGGARASGRSSSGLNAGQWADLIGVSTDNEFLCNREGDILLDSLVVSGGGQACIQDVWSAGRHIVQNGRHTARERITGEFISVLRELEQKI